LEKILSIFYEKKYFLIVFVLFTYSCSKEDVSPLTTFELQTNLEPKEGGVITPEKGSFKEDEEVRLQANPSEGFIFSNWKGDMAGSENPVSLKMDKDKKITAVFVKETSILKSKLIGKWNIIDSNASKNYGLRKQQDNTETKCVIFSVIFYSDGSFVIITSNKEIKGDYIVDSTTSVVLENTGRLDNVQMEEYELSFQLNIFDYCETQVVAQKDADFSNGDCLSFLGCFDDTVWISKNNDQIEFLALYNDLDDIWFENSIFDEDRNCLVSSITNQTGNKTYKIIENSSISFAFLQEREDGNITTKYVVREDGILEASFEYPNDTYYKYFEPSSKEVLESYTDLSSCQNLDAELIFEATSNSSGLALYGNYLYISAQFDDTIYKLNWTEENPTAEPFLNINRPSDLEVDDGFLYISTTPNFRERKVVRVNLALPEPVIEEIITLDGQGLAIENSKLFVSSRNNIYEINLENDEPTLKLIFDNMNNWGTPGLSVIDNYLYATDDNRILRWNLGVDSPETEVVLDGVGRSRGITEKLRNSFYFVNSNSPRNGDFLSVFDLETANHSIISMNLNFDPDRNNIFASPYSIVGNENFLFISALEGGGVIRVKL